MGKCKSIQAPRSLDSTIADKLSKIIKDTKKVPCLVSLSILDRIEFLIGAFFSCFLVNGEIRKEYIQSEKRRYATYFDLVTNLDVCLKICYSD